jgi:hypothetical protein
MALKTPFTLSGAYYDIIDKSYQRLDGLRISGNRNPSSAVVLEIIECVSNFGS